MKAECAYVFFAELAGVQNSFVHTGSNGDLVFALSGLRQEEVSDDERLDEHVSAEGKIANLQGC